MESSWWPRLARPDIIRAGMRLKGQGLPAVNRRPSSRNRYQLTLIYAFLDVTIDIVFSPKIY
jgi:hypothetical protein